MSHEFEMFTAQVQMDEINAGMMKYVVWAYGNILRESGHLSGSGSAKEAAEQMMLIAVEVDQHFQREGSLEHLNVWMGVCLRKFDQSFYVRNSLMRHLVDPKEMEWLKDRSCLKGPSSIDGLEIRREEQGNNFVYFLADKEANLTEAG